MIIFLVLVWSIILLVLVHLHLENRDTLLLSSWRDTLETLSRLLPEQSAQVADSILKASGIVATQQLVNLTKIEKEVIDELESAEDDPYIPPWETINPTDISKTGQWGGTE